MDENEFALALLAALLRPPPESNSILGKLIFVIMMIVTPPADPLLDIRHRFDSDSGNVERKRFFRLFSNSRFGSYESTGESPESLIDLSTRSSSNRLSHRNRILLFLIWLRCYPTYHVLSTLLDISVMTVKDEIHSLIPVLFSICKTFIKWPTGKEWRERINTWSQLPFAVGAIDGTSVKINKPR
jgi:hypothetical protein